MPDSALLRDEPLIEPAFVSPNEAARFLSLSRPAIYKLLDDGVIKSARHGTRHLVELVSLREYAQSLPRRGGPDPA